ncbi:bacterio-opsin activator domain-containing protein [Natronomonas marina]|jgi:PAS domain S-box-containing protein|uniref:bacterio-opsin activator domain-containing protein n=1 Tax=Natronomonas marina TaxID=2961939 RepID=UPI0020C95D2D|nr:bacterio-opsin activator domain-containing protein [Natronomonas marina]
MNDTGGPAARVLFVTERPARWRGARAALEARDGLSVAVAEGVPDGRIAPDVDCVVGIHDDATDGLALLEAVRELRPSLPFVLLSGVDDGRVASRAVSAGVSEFVPALDPGAEDLLVDRVEGAVAERRPARDGGSVPMPIDDVGIREELRLKERAIDEAPVGITITDPDRPDNPMIYINDAFEELTGYDKAEAVGRNCRFLQGEDSDGEAIDAMREAVDEGEPVSVELLNYRPDGEPFWNKVDIAPVHGPDGEVTNFVGFQTDITDRKEAEMEARRRREELEHLLVRIDGLLQDVTRELVQAGSRPEIERAVCERVAADDTYEFGWIGAPDYATETIVASAQAGEWSPTEEALAADLSDEEGGPTVAAYRTGEIQVVGGSEDLADLAARTPWLDADDLGGVAAIPLSYGETTYGVLTLYTTDGAALNEHEMVVMAALGRAAGTAINALERGRILASDSVTELVLETTDSDLFFVELSKETGSYLEFDGSVHRDDGSVLTFFTTDADAEAVRDVAAGYPDIESASPIHEFDDATLWEFGLANASITATLAERGVKISSITVADGTAEISVELPKENEVRAIVELVRERYPDTKIAAHRERERPPQTRRGFVADLEERLTERQLTALRKAHVSGYYEWNRSVTGEELATSMGIDRSTYHQHLRAAERKLTEAFFERAVTHG